MKVIGFSSGGVGHMGNVDRMVKAIMAKSGHEAEFVKLTELNYSACKGCVQLCAGPQVCQLADDLLPYYQKIKEADAVVIGSPVYFGTVNAAALSFVERFYGYRHRSVAIQNKLFVLVVCGSVALEPAAERLQKSLKLFRVKVLDTVLYRSGMPPCLSCGHHKECSIGGLYAMVGETAHSLEITPEFFHRWEDDDNTVVAIERAGVLLSG